MVSSSECEEKKSAQGADTPSATCTNSKSGHCRSYGSTRQATHASRCCTPHQSITADAAVEKALETRAATLQQQLCDGCWLMLQQQLCGGCWLHAIGSTKQVAGSMPRTRPHPTRPTSASSGVSAAKADRPTDACHERRVCCSAKSSPPLPASDATGYGHLNSLRREAVRVERARTGGRCRTNERADVTAARSRRPPCPCWKAPPSKRGRRRAP